MANAHHGHHHHHDEPAPAGEIPLDAANQSLADALRTSFGILKFVMLVLAALYCFSGVQCIQQHEEAVVFRFGRLLPEPRGPGLSRAFPYPIDETVRYPTKRSNQFLVGSHWPNVTAEQEAKSLAEVRPGGGLNPGLDGALLTSDRGMVHVQWAVTYQVTDLRKYVLNIAQKSQRDVERLITSVLENTAIDVVSQYTAEEVTRSRASDIPKLVRAEVNDRLEAMGSGISLTALDVPRSSVPGQTIEAFNNVTKAENDKQSAIRKAQQEANQLLNETAGAVHGRLIDLIDERDRAAAAQDGARLAAVGGQIAELLELEAAGEAGRKVRQARSFYTEVVQKIQGDVEEYESVRDEYLSRRDLFVTRMWEGTLKRVLQYKGVRKHFLAADQAQLRIKLGEDPLQRKLDEMEELEAEAQARAAAGGIGPMKTQP